MNDSLDLKRTLVIIPAWNEADAIVSVVRELQECIPHATLLVVDDGSDDATVARAREAGARVAALPLHEGVGAASQTGYRYAVEHGFEVIGHCDSDGQHPAAGVRELLELVAAGQCDLAIGSRFLADHADQHRPTFSRRIGIFLFRRYVGVVARQRVTDPTSGMRAMSAAVAAEFARCYPSDHPELETYARAARMGFRVREHGVLMRHRIAGSSKITPLRSVFFIFHTVLAVGAAASHLPRRSAS